VIERYTLPEMGEIWTDAYKFQTWLQVEIAVCEAQAELGHIPQAAVDEIKAKAKFDVDRILEIEAEVRHDVIAFLTNVNEHVGEAGRYIHLGMTSSDVLDTALALQMVASIDILLTRMEDTIQAIRYQAQKHRNTITIGRSHGVHAEPITFGFKLAGWLAEMLRNRDRLVRTRQTVAVGKYVGVN
jgi:adenylosuccinate lyase